MNNKSEFKKATFGAGCFWCVEAVFERIEGVISVVAGYADCSIKNPSYKEVCTGTTGCAEVIRLKYDPNVVSFTDLLKVFWKTHDPTTLNRQGNDVGTQYRSAVFCHDNDQLVTAKSVKEELQKAGIYKHPIVTEIKLIDNFYEAENYHQNFYENNPDQSYCKYIIEPKLDKLNKQFQDFLKPKYSE